MPPLSGWTLWITDFVGEVDALDDVMSFLASDFFIPVAIALVMLALWVGHPDALRRDQLQRAVMNASVAIGVSTLTVRIINLQEFWPRPFDVVQDLALRDSARHAADIIFYRAHDPSFPSNAATVAFAAATCVWLGHRFAGSVLFLLAFLWTFARFYGGIHFAMDLAVGAMIGVATALMISKLFMPRTEPIPTWALRLARSVYLA
jgi:undecaprenyl-diphosphatase